MHYYEDGNVRLTTSKPVAETSISSSGIQVAAEVMKQIAGTEKKYQEELNRGFMALSEGSFKSLRRQLPVTRQKVEWEKVGGYRVSLSSPAIERGRDFGKAGGRYGFKTGADELKVGTRYWRGTTSLGWNKYAIYGFP